MFCLKCGKENKDEVHFCKFCGEPLTPSTVDSDQTYTQQVSDAEDKKKNYIIIGLVVLIAIVLLVAGLTAAGVFNSK